MIKVLENSDTYFKITAPVLSRVSHFPIITKSENKQDHRLEPSNLPKDEQ